MLLEINGEPRVVSVRNLKVSRRSTNRTLLLPRALERLAIPSSNADHNPSLCLFLFFRIPARAPQLAPKSGAKGEKADPIDDGSVGSPLSGVVVALKVEKGDTVEKGQALAVMSVSPQTRAAPRRAVLLQPRGVRDGSWLDSPAARCLHRYRGCVRAAAVRVQAMKMETTVTAPITGVVERLAVSTGASIQVGDLIVYIKGGADFIASKSLG